jgi:polar amino acid transport system substrate-binding protein
MHPRKILVGVVVSALALFSLARPALAEPEIDQIKQRKTLIVAMPKEDRYPYCYTLKGQTMGFDVDLAKKIAEGMQVTPQIDRTITDTADLIRKMNNHEADLAMAGMKVLLGQATQICFTSSYLSMEYAVLINRLNLAAVRQLDDPLVLLRENCARIGVMDQPQNIDYVHRLFPRAKVLPFPSMDRLVQATLDGRLMAAFTDEVEGKSLFLTKPELGLQLQYVQIPKISDDLGAVTAWDRRHLRSWMNLYLQNVPPNMTVDKVLISYPLP